MKRFRDTGFSALPTILIVSMVMVEIAVISVVLANAFNNTRFGERLAAEAYVTARAGADDAILRVLRHKDCPSSPGCPASYLVSVGERSASISITDNGDSVTIVSSGSAFLRSKNIQVLLGVSSSTGEVFVQSLDEVAL